MEDSTSATKKSKNAKKRARMKARRNQDKQLDHETSEEQEDTEGVDEDGEDVVQEERSLVLDNNNVEVEEDDDIAQVGAANAQIAERATEEVKEVPNLHAATDSLEEEIQPACEPSSRALDMSVTPEVQEVEECEPSMSDLLRSISESVSGLPVFTNGITKHQQAVMSEDKKSESPALKVSSSVVPLICSSEAAPVCVTASPLPAQSLQQSVPCSSSTKSLVSISSSSNGKYAFEEAESAFLAREKEMENIAKESNYAAMAAVSSLSLMETQAACSLVSQQAPTPRQTKPLQQSPRANATTLSSTANKAGNGVVRSVASMNSTPCRKNLTSDDAKWLESLAKTAVVRKQGGGSVSTRQHQEQIVSARRDVGDSDEDEEEDMYLTHAAPTIAVTTNALDADDIKSPAEVRRSLLCLADEDEPPSTSNERKKTLGFFEAIFTCASVAEK